MAPSPGLHRTSGPNRARSRAVTLLLAAAGMFSAPAQELRAQESALAARCAAALAGQEESLEFCNLVAQAVEVAQPRLGLAFAAGNPVPGTASTLGMRIGTLPRFSLNGRLTLVTVELPQILERGDLEEIDFVFPSINLDGSVGVFAGFTPAATVGGVASLDLLGSVGFLPLPGGEGFEDGSAFGWGLGARLGILRESFTLPGISVSAMYRRVGDVTFGDPRLVTDDAFFSTDLSNISFRGAIGKRLVAGIGLTGGVGYDRYDSDIAFGLVDPDDAAPVRIGFDGFENDRWSLFANASLTFLVLHLIAEFGWQQGGDAVPGDLPAGIRFDPEDSAFFGSLALRFSI